MLKIENYEVIGWGHAIRGMRNPMNSWDRGDSERKYESPHDLSGGFMDIGPNDYKLMMSLAKGGPVHAKYRRMITVYLDITAPLYWWKEFDTYKVGTVANSCSTMHKIHEKEFTIDDFSHEHLMDVYACGWGDAVPMRVLQDIVDCLNDYRAIFLATKSPGPKKRMWWQMIQLLPTSYNQKRTIMLNYEVLHNIYESRRNHKLDEWHTFCDWIEELPYSEMIIREKGDTE